MMKTRGFFALWAVAGMAACQGPTTSSHSDPPRGTANATILENLALIRSLEAASGRDSILVALGGYASPASGTSFPGDGWGYLFAARPNHRLYAWSVYYDGRIEFQGEKSDSLHYVMAEIGQSSTLTAATSSGLRKHMGRRTTWTAIRNHAFNWARASSVVGRPGSCVSSTSRSPAASALTSMARRAKSS